MHTGRTVGGALIALALGVFGCSDEGASKAGLELPMIPVTEYDAYVVAIPATDGTNGLIAESTLVMALAEGYPEAIDVRLSTPYWTSCGQLAGAPTFEGFEVIGGAAAFEAEMLNDASGFSLRAIAQGEGDVVLRGRYQPDPNEGCAAQLGTESVPFEVRFHVSVERPSGFALSHFDCPPDTDAIVVATSSKSQVFAALLGTSGEVTHFVNASPDRQVSITLEADAMLEAPEEDEGLEALAFPAQPGRIRVVPALGEPIDIDVVDASQVTGLQVSFGLGGVAGGDVPVEDGMTYEGGWGRVSNRLAPIIEAAMIGSKALCGAPSPAWFELQSETPSRCDVQPMDPSEYQSLVFANHTVELSAAVLQDGVCSLRVRMPSFDGGKGFEQSIDVTLLNVDGMIAWPP